MRLFETKAVYAVVLAVVLFIRATATGPEPRVRSVISANEFVKAVEAHRTPVIDLYLEGKFDVNARATDGRTLLVAAIAQRDWVTAQRLIDLGASVDVADIKGVTPLMAVAAKGPVDMLKALAVRSVALDAADYEGKTAAHHAIATGNAPAVKLLLPLMPNLGGRCADGRDMLAMAIDSTDSEIVSAVLDGLPQMEQWTASTRRALEDALEGRDEDQIRLLLDKHEAAPTPEGKAVPLLAYAIASDDALLLETLLACGADPDTILPPKCDKDFLDLLPSKSLRYYIEYDRGITMLMLSAALGESDQVRLLLDAGANKKLATKKSKMLALYLAARTDDWRCTQMLLGSGPSPEELRIEISLKAQQAAIIRNGAPVFSTNISTGRPGFTTRTGSYVITDKNRSHRSTIYRVEMPYFMRLSCADFGMHQGVVPNYPASHGCIRLPAEAARKLFSEIPVGTLVTVQ